MSLVALFVTLPAAVLTALYDQGQGGGRGGAQGWVGVQGVGRVGWVPWWVPGVHQGRTQGLAQPG